MNIIEKAFQFALTKHEGQYRKGTNIPYITHPFAVSMILQHHNYSDNVVAAGLLHDILEDTDATEDDLLKLFNASVLELVKAASETDKSLSWEERKQATINELPLKTRNQLAVIVADKLHNVRSIQHDINQFGDVVWDRFNRPKQDQAWYYENFVNTLNELLEKPPLVERLDLAVEKLFSETK